MSSGWTFGGVFKRMAHGRKTGVLEVVTPEVEHRIHLVAGVVVDLQSTPPDRSRFAEFLVASDTLTRGELKRARRRAEKAGRTLEDYLVHAELLSEDALNRSVELHVRESILGFFDKAGITCQFVDETPRKNLWMSPQPISWFLKEAKRRTELWPSLRKRIPNDALVFDKVEEHIETILGKGFVVHEQVRPASEEHGRREDPEEDARARKTVKVRFGAAERSAYYFANGRKTVRQIAFASGLGDFDTYLALIRLYDRGYIHVTDDEGPGERSRTSVPVVPALLKLVAWCLAAGIIGALVVLCPGVLADPGSVVSWSTPTRRSAEARQGRAVVARALEVYAVRTGRYPESLDRLADDGLVDPVVLSEVVSHSRYRAHARSNAGFEFVEATPDVVPRVPSGAVQQGRRSLDGEPMRPTLSD